MLRRHWLAGQRGKWWGGSGTQRRSLNVFFIVQVSLHIENHCFDGKGQRCVNTSRLGFTKTRKIAPKTDEMLDDLADGLLGVTAANSTATSIFATPALARSSATVSRSAEWPLVRLPIHSLGR